MFETFYFESFIESYAFFFFRNNLEILYTFYVVSPSGNILTKL